MTGEIFSAESFLWSCFWQSTIFLVAGLLGSFLFRRHSAKTHRVLFLAMIAGVIVPAVSTLVKHYEIGLFVAEPAVIQLPTENRVIHKTTGLISNEATMRSPAPSNEDLHPAIAFSEAAKFPWLSALLYVWIAASLILVTRLLVTFVLGVRLLGRSSILQSEKIEQAVHLAKSKLGINKDVRVHSSSSVRSPVIWCWGRRPVLILPSTISQTDNGIDWAGVLCHELAHYKRRDHVTGLLAELTVYILPWHPLLWWAKLRLISLSEHACDDWVVAAGRPGTDYAESLLNLIPEGQMAFMPAVVSSRRGLAGRIHRILKDRCGNPRTGAAWALTVCIVTISFAVGIAFAQTRPAKKETVKDKQAESGQARIIRFPKDRSMGMLYMLDWDKFHTSTYSDWEPICEATGNVTVPTGKALRLNLNKDAGDDLSPLSKLKPNDLQILLCTGVEIPDEQLKQISHLTGLLELYLRKTGILGTGLKYLIKLKLLERIDLGITDVGDKELAYLSNLPSLKRLNLSATPTNDAGMEHVGKIKSLTKLLLSRGVGNEGLRHLKGLTSLSELYSSNQAISDEGLEHLAGLTQMETLGIGNSQISDKGLVHLRQMSQLKKLVLSYTRVTENGLAQVKGLKSLEHLGLPFNISDIGLEHVSQLDFLKGLKIDGDSVTDKGLTKLAKMKSLEGVLVRGEENIDEIVAKLAILPGLKNLELGRGLTDKGLARLKDIKSLQSLSLNGRKITGKAMTALTELPFLRKLSIRYMNLSDEEYWINLGKLTSLERLDLTYIQPKVTNANISHLSGLQSLKDLSVVSVVVKDNNTVATMDVTDEGLMHLSKLKALERLSLTGAKITDEGLQQLSKIPNLKVLRLHSCGVTEHGLQQLKKKLPALYWN